MVVMAAKTREKADKRNLISGRYSKGTSGNPAGRPAGSRNKSTLLSEEMLQGQAPAIIQKAIDLALKGDTTALRLCLERICPPRKERLIDLPLPLITEARHADSEWSRRRSRHARRGGEPGSDRGDSCADHRDRRLGPTP